MLFSLDFFIIIVSLLPYLLIYALLDFVALGSFLVLWKSYALSQPMTQTFCWEVSDPKLHFQINRSNPLNKILLSIIYLTKCFLKRGSTFEWSLLIWDGGAKQLSLSLRELHFLLSWILFDWFINQHFYHDWCCFCSYFEFLSLCSPISSGWFSICCLNYAYLVFTYALSVTK